MASNLPSTSPLRSEFADDADMSELLAMFVSELGDRIARLEDGLAHNRLADLRTLAHQLKGAAGGYGYPEVSRVAGVLESCLLRTDTSTDPSALLGPVRDLADICRRAIAGHTPPH